MPCGFELLSEQQEPAVRVVLGHFIFVYPYFDGNGRMGRFLMNVSLASGGCPWTVIPVERSFLKVVAGTIFAVPATPYASASTSYRCGADGARMFRAASTWLVERDDKGR